MAVIISSKKQTKAKAKKVTAKTTVKKPVATSKKPVAVKAKAKPATQAAKSVNAKSAKKKESAKTTKAKVAKPKATKAKAEIKVASVVVPEKPKVKNRVPPRIVKRIAPIKKPTEAIKALEGEQKQKILELGLLIAQEKKILAQKEDEKRSASEISLSRRPTTRARGSATVQFPESDLKEFRKRLLDARKQVMSGVNTMKSAGFSESDDHEVDGGDGTNQTLRLQALGQMGNLNRIMRQIEEALHRIDDGTYGVCTVCGQLIRKPRLMNQPFVLTCMECQSELERSF